jgi:hypothetical protein
MKVEDLTNRKFNRLTPMRYVEKYTWHCKCDCGNERNVKSMSLKNGNTQSCGCLGLEKLALHRTKHGMSDTPEYMCWEAMKERCYKPKTKRYKNYGGRGIKVCDRWASSFENFLADMGRRPTPKHSIDRINNDGNYEPSNCRWADNKTQQRNRSNNKNFTYNGKIYALSELEEIFNLSRHIIEKRLNNNISLTNK